MDYQEPKIKIVPIHCRTIVCQSPLETSSGTTSSFEIDDDYEEMD